MLDEIINYVQSLQRQVEVCAFDIRKITFISLFWIWTLMKNYSAEFEMSEAID